MADGTIIINTDIDQSGFNRGVKDIKKGAENVKKSLGGIKSSLAGLAGKISVVFGVASVVAFGKASVKAATELTNAMTGLKSVMDGQGKSFEAANKFIQQYTQDGLIPATDAITAYKNLALRGYDTTQIEQVMTALKDASAYGRQSSYTMGEAIKSATEGLKNENSVLVDNAGVTKNVAQMWEDYAKSIGTTVNNLTKQQKIQAEVMGIMEETKFQTGDAAKVSNSFSGQLLRLQYSFNNLKIAIGNAIIPVINTVLPVINTLITWLTKLGNVFAQVVASIIGTGQQQATEMSAAAEGTQKAAAAQDNLATSIKKAAKAAKGALAPFDKLNVLQSGDKDEAAEALEIPDSKMPQIPIAPGTELGKDITVSPDVQAAVNKIKKIFDGIKTKMAEVKAALSPSFDAWKTAFYSLQEPVQTAMSAIGASLSTLWTETLGPICDYLILEFVPGITNSFSTNLAPVFSDVLGFALEEGAKDFEFFCQQYDKYVKDIFKPAMETVKKVANDVMSAIKNEWDKSGQMLMDSLSRVKESFRQIWTDIYEKTLKPVIDKIWAKVNDVWDKHLKPLWEEVLSFFSKLGQAIMTIWNNFLGPIVKWLVNTLGPIVAKVVNGIIDTVSDVINAIIDVVKGILKALGGLLDFITGMFSGEWKKAWEGIKTVFSGIWDGMWSIVKLAVNKIIDGINLLWGGIYKVVKGIVDSIGGVAGALGDLFGADWHFSMPEEPRLIPKLARGGITTGPTIAQIGERGKEAVLPLENNTTWMDILAARLAGVLSKSGGGTGGEVIIPIYLDGLLLDEYIISAQERVARRTNGRGF